MTKRTVPKILIAPSLLAADFSRLGEEAKSVELAGADLVHVDVCDGRFVPNISIGEATVAALKSWTKLPLDVHLMIEAPGRSIPGFAHAGSDYLTFHVEACRALGETISAIKSFGKKAGVVLNPKTPLSAIEGMLDQVDMVLLMTVEPGFAGQRFIESVLPKIRQLRKIWDGDIEVDGGINCATAKKAVEAGANILVAGTAVFGQANRRSAIRSLRGCRR